ncbi:hypothetical protein BVRB_2g030380 [Beta vulgaris subsp. vulgaris]|nr:hypothetical protein BVRB_2g030380 [Beta vulgaris subsp. vulgaris]
MSLELGTQKDTILMQNTVANLVAQFSIEHTTMDPQSSSRNCD